MSEAARIEAVVETAIYVGDLEAAEVFYRDVLGLEVIGWEAGRHVLIRAEGLDGWRRRIEGHGVVIEKEVGWPRGGRSIYFRDPAGNSVELVTPGLWGSPGGW
jgi:catechol 2,3-dioxygenase-like lactoylglutathione lyase family enzyme